MPAVPEPLDRRPATSAPTAPCTSAAATARASRSRTTARAAAAPAARRRRTRAAIRRPARRDGMAPPDRRGRRPAQPELPAAERASRSLLNGAILRVDPATGDAHAGQPGRGAAATPTRAGSSPTACATRSASPSGRGTNELWIGDVGWGTWEEINRSLADHCRRVNFGWPCYEGDSPQPRLPERRRSICAARCTAAGTATPPVLHVQPQRPRRRRRQLPDRQLVDHRRSPSTPGQAHYPASYNGGLFFGDYTRELHLVHAASGRTACPTRRSCSAFETGALGPGRPGDRAERRPLLRRPEQRADPRDQVRRRREPAAGRGGDATPTSGDAPLAVNFDGSARRIRMRGTRSRIRGT